MRFSFIDPSLGEKYEAKVLESGLDGLFFVSQNASAIVNAIEADEEDVGAITDAFDALTARERPFFMWSAGQVSDHLVALNSDFLDTFADQALAENITGEKYCKKIFR